MNEQNSNKKIAYGRNKRANDLFGNSNFRLTEKRPKSGIFDRHSIYTEILEWLSTVRCLLRLVHKLPGFMPEYFISPFFAEYRRVPQLYVTNEKGNELLKLHTVQFTNDILHFNLISSFAIKRNITDNIFKNFFFRREDKAFI